MHAFSESMMHGKFTIATDVKWRSDVRGVHVWTAGVTNSKSCVWILKSLYRTSDLTINIMIHHACVKIKILLVYSIDMHFLDFRFQYFKRFQEECMRFENSW